LDLLEHGAHDIPSVIVLDLMMPLMDGRELMSRLAASDRLRRIPVVATTALPHLAQGHGFAGILAKPFELGELVDEVRRHAPARGEG
jgi:CheY-like chemotaxis protein